MEGNQSKRRIRLKCRYDGEIRIVTVTPETEFTDMKKRLSTDYGFDVSLKYEDRDGDVIILASQNDLDDVFLNTETETINVIISETLSLPNLQLKGTNARTGMSTASSAGMTSLYNTSNVNMSSITGSTTRDWPKSNTTDALSSSISKSQSIRPVNGARLDRFPNIADSGAQHKQEIFNIRWKKGEMLGQGAFGVVYLGLNIDSGELMAVKQMATEDVSKRELSSLENEIHLLRNLRHPNIVRYIGTELNPESMSIFLEYVPGGSLKALIDKFGQLEESVAKSYTRQLLIGLEYLHRHGIAHRDIKGANCLVGNDGVIKLADFGNSKHWRPPSTTASIGPGKGPGGQTSSGDIKGTPSWMAPEVIRDEGGSISWRKADIWSLACTTLEMTTGKAPWKQFDNPVTILYHIACQDTLPEYPSPASFELITFLNTCLQRDPKMRPDITSLLMHPFVSHMVLPPGVSASSNWAANSQSQFGNRPTTVSHAVVGEWDRDRDRALPASTFYSTQNQATLMTADQLNVGRLMAAGTSVESHVPQVFTLDTPTNMPLSARGLQHLQMPGNAGAEDPELSLEVDHSRTHSRVPSIDVDFAQLSAQTTPRVAQYQTDAGGIASVGQPRTLPNRLAALTNTSASPGPARTKVASKMKQQQSPVSEARAGASSGVASSGGSGSKSAQYKRNKKQAAATVRDTDSPLNTSTAVGAMEAQLVQLLSNPAGRSGEKADSFRPRSPMNRVMSGVNEDDIVTPPTTITIPKLNLQPPVQAAPTATATDLFHKNLLAAAEDDPYLRTNLEYPSSNYPSSRSNRSGTGPPGAQGNNAVTKQPRKQKGAKKQPRSRLRSDFSSFDSEDTSGWYQNAAKDLEIDADSTAGAGDDDTLYSAEMLAGYSSTEGGLEDSTPLSGIVIHSRADGNPSSVLSHANSNLTVTSTNSPINATNNTKSAFAGASSSFAAIQTAGAQESDFKKVVASAESGSKGVLRPNFTKPQVITGPVSWKRLNNSSSRSQMELAVEDVNTPTTSGKDGRDLRESKDLKELREGTSRGTNVIKPTSLQTAPSGWRRQDKRDAQSASTVMPSTTVDGELQDSQFLYAGGLTKSRSYGVLGDSLDEYASATEEIPDESNVMLHEDSNMPYTAPRQHTAAQAQQRRSQVQKAHNRQRERERERDTAQLETDIADMTALMNVTGTNFEQARMSTASGMQLQNSNASVTGSMVLGTPSANSSSRTNNSLKNSHSKRSLEVVSTPTVGASRHGSRQPLRTANRMHRERDTEKGDVDPLDISCDSLDKLHIMGTAAANNTRTDVGKYGEREGSAKALPSSTRQSRRGAGANTAGGSRRAEEPPAYLAQTYTGNANLSTSIDDEPEGAISLFSAPPTSFDEHTGAITRLRAPERTNLLLSSSLDGTIRIWGPESSTDGNGSRAVLEATGFKSDNVYGAFADQRPERRITLGAADGDLSSLAGTGTGTARSSTVKISNMWVDEACETIWATCSDTAIRVWSGGEGRPLRLLKGHEDQITAMEGMDTASSSASHLLQSSVSGNPSTCLVATGSADRTVRVWDVRAKKAQVFSFRGHGDTVLALKWGEGGRSLVSAAKDKSVRIWDTRAGRLRVTLEKHFGSVSCIRVLPTALAATSTNPNTAGNSNKLEGEGAAVVSAGRDSMINVWSNNGDCLSSQAAHRGTVSFLSEINNSSAMGHPAGLNSRSYYSCPLSSNPLMLSLGTDGAIKLWDMRRYRCISEINPGNQNGNFTKAVWCNTGFVAGSNTGVVRLYENSGVSDTLTSARDVYTAGYSTAEAAEIVARSGSGSPSALAYTYGHPSTAPGTAAGAVTSEWVTRDLAMHSAASTSASSTTTGGSASAQSSAACTDLICTDSLLASGSKSGQILRWSR